MADKHRLTGDEIAAELEGVTAGHRLADHEPDELTVELARRQLRGEITADEAVQLEIRRTLPQHPTLPNQPTVPKQRTSPEQRTEDEIAALLEGITAGHRLAEHEPDEETVELARRQLRGEITTEYAVRTQIRRTLDEFRGRG